MSKKIENRALNRGVEQGVSQNRRQMYLKLIHKGKSMEEIADLFDTSVEEVQGALNYQA